jgi:hypothetical protein
MPRKKLERVRVPRDGEISKKAMKTSEQSYWGFEPTWGADYADITKREWNGLDKDERIRKYPRFANVAHLEWFQLKPEERQEIVDFEITGALIVAFNWYNAMVEDTKQKEYLIAYAEKNFPEKISGLKKVDEHYCHGVGALARCIMRGAMAPKKVLDQLKEKIESLATMHLLPQTSVISVAPTSEKPIITRDSRLMELIGIVDGQLDDFGVNSKKSFPDQSMADALLKAGASNGQRLKVHEHFQHDILEYNQVLNDVDGVKEYYEGIPKKQIQKVYNWMTGKPSENLVVSKKPRKPRKKKEKTAEQILKHFSCLVEDKKLKLKSIDPESILGAQQLWIFNVKTRKLGVYHALDDTGLGVARKSITNYDEKRSVCKKVRKPAELVPGVVTAGKVALRHILDEIRAVESPLKSRIGDDILLLRVVK